MSNIFIIDVHSHMHFPEFENDREDTIKRARQLGVKMITVGVQFSDSEKAVALARKYPDDIWATVGFHPNDLDEGTTEGNFEIFDAKKFLKLARDEKVVAIGECGLDYFRIMNNELRIKNEQRKIFQQQIELAQKVGKALMIHCRSSKGTNDAYEDLLNLIKDLKFTPAKIAHFYSGDLNMAKKLIKEDFYFTFGGAITFPVKAHNRNYREIIEYLPVERIMLETDAPYVAPEPYRGKRNEPAYIIKTAEKMAEIKKLSFDRTIEILLENSQKVFGFKV